jgi:type IV fimbrial biogenesis protein FimT
VLKARGETGQPAGGFTLVELLVTIVVLSILLGLAVPAFRSFLQNDQQWTQTSNLVVGLKIARSEAIKDDASGAAQICSSRNGTTCTLPAGQHDGTGLCFPNTRTRPDRRGAHVPVMVTP